MASSPNLSASITMTNHIDASNSFFDNPQSLDALADKMMEAITAKMRAKGLRV